jgi:hypothetical protein
MFVGGRMVSVETVSGMGIGGIKENNRGGELYV